MGAAQSRWREANKEYCAEKQKEWVAENREARNAYMREWWKRPENRGKQAARNRRLRKENPGQAMWRRAKCRSKERGIEFSLTVDDIKIVDTCPVLGIPLVYDSPSQCPNSASLDRTDSTKGYIPGNVAVISWRANNIKNDGTAEEHQAVADYLRRMREAAV